MFPVCSMCPQLSNKLNHVLPFWSSSILGYDNIVFTKKKQGRFIKLLASPRRLDYIFGSKAKVTTRLGTKPASPLVLVMPSARCKAVITLVPMKRAGG